MTSTLNLRCPDCNARPIGRQLSHEDSCPAGRAYDQGQADDALWFALRSRETIRRRPPHSGEITYLRIIGIIPEGADVHGEVVVIRLADGIRAKRYDGLWWIAAVPA